MSIGLLQRGVTCLYTVGSFTAPAVHSVSSLVARNHLHNLLPGERCSQLTLLLQLHGEILQDEFRNHRGFIVSPNVEPQRAVMGSGGYETVK